MKHELDRRHFFLSPSSKLFSLLFMFYVFVEITCFCCVASLTLLPDIVFSFLLVFGWLCGFLVGCVELMEAHFDSLSSFWFIVLLCNAKRKNWRRKKKKHKQNSFNLIQENRIWLFSVRYNLCERALFSLIWIWFFCGSRIFTAICSLNGRKKICLKLRQFALCCNRMAGRQKFHGSTCERTVGQRPSVVRHRKWFIYAFVLSETNVHWADYFVLLFCVRLDCYNSSDCSVNEAWPLPRVRLFHARAAAELITLHACTFMQ